MADTSSQALTKRKSEDMALMPPPPAPKRIKRPSTVLDEDVYTDALSHIIARDFFPGLLETQVQQEYLAALEAKNNDWIREAGRKLTQAMTPGPDGRRGRRGTSMVSTVRGTQTPGQTPRGGWAGSTPGRSISATPDRSRDFAPEEPERPKVDYDLGLSAFQSKYTSEDNESFNALLDKQNEERRKKYGFLYNGNKIPTARQIAYREREQKLLSSRAQQEEKGALILRPSQDLDQRPASFESFPTRQGAHNALMFRPDSIEDSHQTIAQKAQEASFAPPKRTNYGGTRLETAETRTTESVPPSPSMSAIDAAIAGRPKASSTDAGYSGAETPRVNGYAFVDAEPTPSEMGTPITDEEADLIEREAAMALLPKSDESGGLGGFKMQSQSRREDIHHRLVEKHDSARRNKGQGSRFEMLKSGLGAAAGRTPTPKFMSSPAVGSGSGNAKTGANMTPAARMLAARIGQTPGREGSLFGGGKGKKAWTPTPVRRKG
ncbi:hypothetical protein MBLNU457_7099t1 [Dothideomycetes sp. NU457]